MPVVVAAGFWSSCDEITTNWVLDVSMDPAADRADADASYTRWRLGVELASGWAAND